MTGLLDPTEVSDYITQQAPQYGIDPNVALKVYQSEGGNGYTGDNGTSFGPYQLHYGGGLGDAFTKQTGLNASDPSTWKKQVDFALSNAASGGWGPWHGARRVGIGNMQGIGPNVSAGSILNEANKTNMAPQGLLTQQGDQSQGDGLLGMPQGMPQMGNSLGAMLMALGGGIASGGAPGGGGWGGGIGRGLEAAGEMNQRNLGMRLQLAALQNNIMNQNRQFGLESQRTKAELATSSGGQAGGFSTMASAAPKFAADYARLTSPSSLWSNIKSGLGSAAGVGITSESADTIKQMVTGAYQVMGKGDVPQNEMNIYVPTPAEITYGNKDIIAAKLEKARQLAASAYQVAAANKPPEWHKQFDPLFAPLGMQQPQAQTAPTGGTTTVPQGGAPVQVPPAAGQQQAGAANGSSGPPPVAKRPKGFPWTNAQGEKRYWTGTGWSLTP